MKIDKINNRIKNNPIENPDLLNQIELVLKNFRGYVFKMPKPGSKVVALMSGGMDTTMSIGLLLDKYQLEVYPIHFVRDWPHVPKQKLIHSCQFFVNYFQKKYPKLMHDLVTLNITYPAKSLQNQLEISMMRFFNNESSLRQGVPFQTSSYTHNVINYLYTMPISQGDQIRTIFMANLGDNIHYAYESLASFRALTLEVCTMLHDDSWQITSLPMERELGYYLSKVELAKLTKYLRLPLENTLTCQEGERNHCGICGTCWSRRNALRDAGITDKTIYESERRDLWARFKNKVGLTKYLRQKRGTYDR